MENNTNNPTADREMLATKLLDAPVELVWEAWTHPEHLANWWGPDGFTNTISEMDMQPGGKFNLTMHGPDGTDYRNESIFTEVIPMKKIVFEHKTGPFFTATITFEARGQQTFLSWHMLFRNREEFLQTVKTFKADEGQNQNIVKLTAYVAKMKQTKA